MRHLAALSLLVFMAACAGLPGSPPFVPPSSRCADEFIQAQTGVIAVPENIAACLSAAGQNLYSIKNKTDFLSWQTNNSSPTFFMNHGCGGYAGDSFKVDFLKGLWVWAYAVNIEPGTYPTVFPHSILVAGVDKAGLIAVSAHLNNSTTECPFNKLGAASAARTG